MSPTPLQRKFTLQLLTEWRRLDLPFGNQPVILAVSGGADSCSLALGIADLVERGKLGCEFIVAHFDHGIRGADSERDAEMVRALAKRLGFRFELGRAEASDLGSGSNLEEKAREARYRFLSRVAAGKAAGFVMTGHTLNDQAETLLLNLVRGAGLSGLAAMDAVRPLGAEGVEAGYDSGSSPLLCRPLLTWAERETTVEYCRDCGIAPSEDAMNDDLAFQRVKVRKELIPILKEMNPQIVATLSSTAEVLSMERDLIYGESLSGPELDAMASTPELSVAELVRLTETERLFVIRAWLGRRRRTLRGLQLKHFRAVADLAMSEKSGRVAELPGNERVLKEKGRLAFEDQKVEK